MPIDVVKLYKEAEESGLKKAVGVNKKDKVLEIVGQVQKQLGKKKLLLSALYACVKAVAEERGLKIERAYFTQLMKKNMKVEKDEKGRLWVIFA